MGGTVGTTTNAFLDAIHDGGVVIVDGHGRVAVPQVQVLVDLVGDGTAGILRLDEDARHHLGLAVPVELGRHHIPGRTQVDVFLFDAYVCERIRVEIAVARKLEPVVIRVDVHLVVADGELVGPALHRIGLVAIEHDIVGHIVEIHPVLVVSLQRPEGVAFSHFLALVERTFHAGHLAALPGRIVGPDVRKGQQDQRQRKKELAAVTQQEATGWKA